MALNRRRTLFASRYISRSRSGASVSYILTPARLVHWSPIPIGNHLGWNCPITNTNGVHWVRVRRWLNTCITSHERTCIPSVEDLPRNFRLIDCETRTLITVHSKLLKSICYLALSYICGQNKDCIAKVRLNSAEKLPNTIEDAIAATKELRFRYLWIDRYCIDYQNEHERHSQIRAMNITYGSAQATLIAAAGGDPHHGLPGVSFHYRTGQLHTTFANYQFVSVTSKPIYLINQTVWNTRAWTFQEALLSSRRIVFTSVQVYFECRAGFCCEQFVPEYPAVFCSLNIPSHLRFYNPVFHVDKGPDFQKFLHEYLRKKLTYPSDILDAFKGILKNLERVENPRYSIFGLPIDLSRTSHSGFLMALSWSNRRSSSRRENFPTWSWCGWTALEPEWTIEGQFNHKSISTEIQLLTREGTGLSWKEISP